jgi:hypothetical protein
VTELAALNPNLNPENLTPKRKSNCEDSKPAIEVITGFGVELRDAQDAKASPSLSDVIADPAKPAHEICFAGGVTLTTILQRTRQRKPSVCVGARPREIAPTQRIYSRL